MSVRTFSQTISPGQPMVTGGGTALFVRTAGLPVDVQFLLKGQSIGNLVGVLAGEQLSDLDPFDSAEISSATEQLVTVEVGRGTVGAYTAGQVQADIVQATSILDPVQVDVGTAAVVALPANGNAKMIVFLNAGGTTIYLGGSGVSNISPVVLAAGASWIEDRAAAAEWWALSSAAGGLLNVMAFE